MEYVMVLLVCTKLSCAPVVNGEGETGLFGCMARSMVVAADYERKNPGHRVESVYCTPRSRVRELLAKLGGMDA